MPLVRAEAARVGEEEVPAAPAAPVERDSATAEAHFETQRKRFLGQQLEMRRPPRPTVRAS